MYWQMSQLKMQMAYTKNSYFLLSQKHLWIFLYVY
jgi:hypothetical protein